MGLAPKRASCSGKQIDRSLLNSNSVEKLTFITSDAEDSGANRLHEAGQRCAARFDSRMRIVTGFGTSPPQEARMRG